MPPEYAVRSTGLLSKMQHILTKSNSNIPEKSKEQDTSHKDLLEATLYSTPSTNGEWDIF